MLRLRHESAFRSSSSYTTRDVLAQLLAAAAGAVSLVAFLRSFHVAPLDDALAIIVCNPVFTTFFARAILGLKIR